MSDGLGIWWLARPAYGRRTALVLLGTLAAFSVVGFLFGESIAREASRPGFWLLQAVIAGSLLHVILRHMPSAPRAGDSPLATRVASEQDRRVAFVEPTPEGRALVEQIRRRRDAYLARRLRSFSADERALLERAAPLLERLIEDPEP